MNLGPQSWASGIVSAALAVLVACFCLNLIAAALQLPETELFGLLDRRARDQLPALQPYLRAKYDLPDTVIADITAFLSRYGDLSTRPHDGEDEEPETPRH